MGDREGLEAVILVNEGGSHVKTEMEQGDTRAGSASGGEEMGFEEARARQGAAGEVYGGACG